MIKSQERLNQEILKLHHQKQETFNEQIMLLNKNIKLIIENFDLEKAD